MAAGHYFHSSSCDVFTESTGANLQFANYLRSYGIYFALFPKFSFSGPTSAFAAVALRISSYGIEKRRSCCHVGGQITGAETKYFIDENDI